MGLDALKKKKLGLPGIDIEVQVDKLIDLAAPPPRGTGVENIRECIIESKMTFDVSSDDWQAYFKANMPKVIKRIYELSWDMFGDLPRGHHKNNSMHKLASKTMIEILPENLANHVEKKCGSLAGTPDFFDVIGQVSWYEPEA